MENKKKAIQWTFDKLSSFVVEETTKLYCKFKTFPQTILVILFYSQLLVVKLNYFMRDMI